MPGFLSGPLNGFTDRSKGRGVVSNSWLAQFGKGSAQAAGGGNLAAFVSQAGIGNGADTTEDVLFTGSLPANSLDVNGRELSIQAWGSVAATSATKTVKLYFGTTVLATITATTTQTGVWIINATIVRAGTSQQAAVVTTDTTISGSLVRAVAVASPSETETAAIVLKVTGQSSVGTANLVTCNGLIPAGYN